MGAWAAGNFENDDALDLLGELTADSAVESLEKLFDAVASAEMRGESIDSPDSARVLAAAELIAAARGHASEDLPDCAGKVLKGLKDPSQELADKACSAVSYVLMRSELVELWSDSKDSSEWNRVVSGLIARLDAPARASRVPDKKQNEMTSCVCSFCSELIPTMELVCLNMRRPWSEPGVSEGIFAHESCLNSRVHPKHIVQWWTLPEL